MSDKERLAIKQILLFAENCEMLHERYECARGSEIIGEHVRLLVTSAELKEAMKTVDGMFDQCTEMRP